MSEPEPVLNIEIVRFVKVQKITRNIMASWISYTPNQLLICVIYDLKAEMNQLVAPISLLKNENWCNLGFDNFLNILTGAKHSWYAQ